MAITPSPAKKKEKGLEVLLGSLMCLYIKAKRYHFNVTGPTFYGDHKTYDKIADGALEWYDVVGERMRAVGLPVCACPEVHSSVSVIPAGIPTDASAPSMMIDMMVSLEMISGLCNTGKFEGGPTTENIIQEVDAFIGKQIYFTRSSL